MVQGDLGYSFAKAEPVTDVLVRSLPPTLLLTGLAFLVEVLIAIPLALWVVSRGWLGGSPAGRPRRTHRLRYPPSWWACCSSTSSPFGWGSSPWVVEDRPPRTCCPVLTLGIPFGLVLARLLRTSLLEQQDQPYITFSAALGEPPWSVRWRHLLPNALLPLLSILALDFAGLFSSVAVVEVAFSMPGLGADLLLGLRRLDTSLIVGIGIVAGLLVALVNLLADVAVIAIDPRVRRES